MSRPRAAASPSRKRGPGGRIHLVTVVHLQDFDIEFRSKHPGGPLDQQGEKVDTNAHVTGLDDRRVTRGGVDLCLILGRTAGRADDVGNAGLGRKLSEFGR